MTRDGLINVIVRTKDSEEYLEQCLKSVLNEIPVCKIIVEHGSQDRALEIMT